MGGTAGEKEGEGEGEGAEGGRGRRPARVDSGSGGRFTRGGRGAGSIPDRDKVPPCCTLRRMFAALR